MELKKTILYIVSTFAIFIIINIALDSVFSRLYILNKNGQSGGKINYYVNITPEPEIIVLGNSRALYQIIPDSFSNPNFYNLCHAGMDDCFQLGILHYITKIGKKPKIILLQIDPEFYIDNFKKEYNSTDIQHLKYYYDKDELIKEEINKMNDFENLKNNIPLYKYNGRLISLIKNYFLSINKDYDIHKGFVKINPTKFDSINTINAFNQKKEFTTTKFSIDKAKYLIRIIEITKEQNIKLICFTSPHYKYNKNEFENINKELNNLFQKNDIKYFNLDIDTSLTKKIENPNYWKDHMHLNLYGASIISPYLSIKLDSIIIKNKQ